jgi:hypothetical protein
MPNRRAGPWCQLVRPLLGHAWGEGEAGQAGPVAGFRPKAKLKIVKSFLFLNPFINCKLI